MIIPNAIGHTSDEKRKSVFDWSIPREGLDIKTPMKSGLIEDFDLFSEILEHTISTRLNSDIRETPILMTEAAWNTREKRQKITEIMYEKFGALAFFLVKSPVCVAFANGRASGIVLDSGATHTTAVGVYEGHVLRLVIVIANNYLKQIISACLRPKISWLKLFSLKSVRPSLFQAL